MHAENSSPPEPKRRGPWLALLVGLGILAILWLVAVLLEPYLQAMVVGSADPEALRKSESVWANSSVWLLSVTFLCVALVFAGFISKRLSSPGSWAAPIALLALIAVYIFFAQFPTTRSTLRITGWAVALPLSFLLGAWIASRMQSAAV